MLWCVLYPEGGVLSCCGVFCNLRGVFYHVVVCFVT